MANVIPGADISSFVGPGYVNHSDLATDGLGNAFAAVTVGSDVWLVKRQQGTAHLSLLHVFDDAVYGKQGYGAVAVVGRHVVVWLSSRQPDGTTRPKEYIVTDVAN
jgi:hypothetical protein